MSRHHDHPGDWTAHCWRLTERGWERHDGNGDTVAFVERKRGPLPFLAATKKWPGLGVHDVEQRAGSIKEAKHLADVALRNAGYTLNDLAY